MIESKKNHSCDSEEQVAENVSGEIKQEVASDDESSLAVLISIVPLLVFTFFGQVGLL